MFYFQIFLILKSWSYFPSIHWLNPSLWFLYGGSLPVVIVVAGLAVEWVGVQVPVKQCPPGHAELALSDLLVLYNVTVKSMKHCCILVSGGERMGGGGQIRLNDTIFTIFLKGWGRYDLMIIYLQYFWFADFIMKTQYDILISHK